jgi:16S rRNA (guanine966-N2)-methyltransferase
LPCVASDAAKNWLSRRPTCVYFTALIHSQISIYLAVPRKRKPSPQSLAATRSRPDSDSEQTARPSELRIIGGLLRGRKLHYSGDPRTRPMKDRVREAVFNLVGPDVKGQHVLDLFAGTGALGMEALSRGAARATFFEQHFPTAAIIRENIASLGVEDRCEVISANTFIQFRPHHGAYRAPDNTPWLVFCSPPYEFYVGRLDELLTLLGTIRAAAPAASVLVVEADQRFDFGRLPQPDAWDVRAYPPAYVGIMRT